MEEEKKEKNNKVRCKKCGSKFGYVRFKDMKFICRNCGSATELNDPEQKETLKEEE